MIIRDVRVVSDYAACIGRILAVRAFLRGIVMHTSRFHIVVVALLLVGVSATLLARDQKSVNHEDQSKAVNVIRLINTAELWYSKGINTKPGAIEAHG